MQESSYGAPGITIGNTLGKPLSPGLLFNSQFRPKTIDY
jgi:hypothetical protein